MTVEETRARKGIAEMYRLRDAANESGQAFRNSYAEAKKLRDNVGGAEMIAIRETVEAMKTPLEQFADGIKTVEDSMQDIALRGLSKLEDGLVGLVQGTKSASDAFRDMASSIINDMIRMVIQRQITAPLAGALNNVIGAAFGGASAPPIPSAIGGSVQSGRTHLVGERGPELFIPSASGSIVPNNAMGGGGVTVVQNINVSTGVQQTVRAEIMTLMPQISNAAKSAVAEARLRGGSFSAAMR
jgi:phage-related minor tail protein